MEKRGGKGEREKRKISLVLDPALVQSAKGSSQLRGPVPVGLRPWGFSLCPFIILAPPSGGYSNSLG